MTRNELILLIALGLQKRAALRGSPLMDGPALAEADRLLWEYHQGTV